MNTLTCLAGARNCTHLGLALHPCGAPHLGFMSFLYSKPAALRKTAFLNSVGHSNKLVKPEGFMGDPKFEVGCVHRWVACGPHLWLVIEVEKILFFAHGV